MSETKSTRGGFRQGAGRKKGESKKAVTFRLSERAIEILDKKDNKTEFINDLIVSSAKGGLD